MRVLAYLTNAAVGYPVSVGDSEIRAGEFMYDVALSFAGEQRAYVQKVAAALRRRGIRPFYDDYEKAALWGKDLYEHLDWIYQQAARYCVLFVSKDYAEKAWTTHERRSAQARALRSNQDYVLPVRFDDTEIPGLRSTILYVEARSLSPGKLAGLIAKKLGAQVRNNLVSPEPDQLSSAFDAASPDERRTTAHPPHSAEGGETLGRRETVTAPAVAVRALPRDIGSFTGREDELRRLMKAVSAGATSGGVVGIHAIEGMAGIGKTALAVHAAHQLAAQFPDGQIFVRLHAHTAGQLPVDPGEALATLLLSIGVAASQIPADGQARELLWRDRLSGKRVLLVLDDAVGPEQVSPLLPGTAGSLVVITSRRRLALEDAVSISLDILTPDEAAVLFLRVAARPDLAPTDACVTNAERSF